MSIWTKTIKRSNTTEIRKEDQILHIRKEGSENAFTEEQIGLFTQIIREAEKFFDQCPSESEKYKIAEKAESVPVILVPWETFQVKRSGECLAFAKKMRDLYDKEMAQIEQKQLTPEERERRMAILPKKYGAWLSCFPTACSDCKQMLTTPLGYYVPDNDGGKIYICLDKIIASYRSDQVDAIAAKVILHEFGHALMHNSGYPNYQTVFDYWVEESLANKIALKYLAVASMLLHKTDLFTVAKKMVKHQSDAYKLGLYLFEHNASDWHTLQKNKTNINQTIGDRWVEFVCDPDHRNICDINRLFYRAFEVNKSSSSSPFDTWILGGVGSKTGKTYSAVINSSFMGLVFKEIMGWRYNTLSECTSIIEVEQLIAKLEDKGSEEHFFNKATKGFAHSAINKYKDYLVSLHP